MKLISQSKCIYACLVAALFICLQPGNAQAGNQEIPLNQSNVYVGEVDSLNEYTLIRSQSTPKVVRLDVQFASKERYCSRQDTRMVYGTHPSCGTYVDYQYSCRPIYNCGPRGPYGRPHHCHPRDPYCYGGGYGYGNGCVANRHCTTIPVTYTRSCSYPQTYCAEYDYRDTLKSEQIVLRFRRLEKLEAGQTEKYDIRINVSNAGEASAQAHAALSAADAPSEYKIKETSKNKFRVSRGLFHFLDGKN